MKRFALSLIRVRGRFAFGTLVVLSLIAVAPGQTALAQQPNQGKYLTEASTRLSKLIAQAHKDGFILQDNNFSIGGGWIKQSQDTWVPLFKVTLEAGKKYRFLAAGDFDAKDVDLDVQDSNGKRVAIDDGTEPEAIVDFTPRVAGEYSVRVRLYDSDKNLPCLCLAIVLRQK